MQRIFKQKPGRKRNYAADNRRRIDRAVAAGNDQFLHAGRVAAHSAGDRDHRARGATHHGTATSPAAASVLKSLQAAAFRLSSYPRLPATGSRRQLTAHLRISFATKKRPLPQGNGRFYALSLCFNLPGPPGKSVARL